MSTNLTDYAQPPQPQTEGTTRREFLIGVGAGVVAGVAAEVVGLPKLVAQLLKPDVVEAQEEGDIEPRQAMDFMKGIITNSIDPIDPQQYRFITLVEQSCRPVPGEPTSSEMGSPVLRSISAADLKKGLTGDLSDLPQNAKMFLGAINDPSRNQIYAFQDVQHIGYINSPISFTVNNVDVAIDPGTDPDMNDQNVVLRRNYYYSPSSKSVVVASTYEVGELQLNAERRALYVEPKKFEIGTVSHILELDDSGPERFGYKQYFFDQGVTDFSLEQSSATSAIFFEKEELLDLEGLLLAQFRQEEESLLYMF